MKKDCKVISLKEYNEKKSKQVKEIERQRIMKMILNRKME